MLRVRLRSPGYFLVQMTLYDDLGASPTATRAELRRAFVDAARRSHPDALHGADRATVSAAAARLRAVTDAWAVLGDPKRRSSYDAELANAARSGDANGAGATAAGHRASHASRSDGARATAAGEAPRPWQSYASPGAALHRSIQSRIMSLAPAVLGGAALAFLGLGYLLRASVIVSLAVFCASAGVFAFLAAPLMAMKEARAMQRRGGTSAGAGGVRLRRRRAAGTRTGRPPSSPHRRQG